MDDDDDWRVVERAALAFMVLLTLSAIASLAVIVWFLFLS
jgi:hypothetical protein